MTVDPSSSKKRSNYPINVNTTENCDFPAVKRSFVKLLGIAGCPVTKVLLVYISIQMEMGFITHHYEQVDAIDNVQHFFTEVF